MAILTENPNIGDGNTSSWQIMSDTIDTAINANENANVAIDNSTSAISNANEAKSIAINIEGKADTALSRSTLIGFKIYTASTPNINSELGIFRYENGGTVLSSSTQFTNINAIISVNKIGTNYMVTIKYSIVRNNNNRHTTAEYFPPSWLNNPNIILHNITPLSATKSSPSNTGYNLGLSVLNGDRFKFSAYGMDSSDLSNGFIGELTLIYNGPITVPSGIMIQ